MGIELPPELAEVAAQTGVAWPEADEEAMAEQAQAWRDTATSMSTLATDADTTADGALSTMSGETATAASTEWKSFVEPDSGHLTSVVKDANAAADRLEHAANQIGAAKVEIVRNLVGLAQNQDAAHAAAMAGHPTALAGLNTAVNGTAANLAHIENQLVTAVRPASGVDIASVQNPVNANPGHHLPPGVAADAVNASQTLADTAHQTLGTHGFAAAPLLPGITTGATDVLPHAASTVTGTMDHTTGAGPVGQLPGTGGPADLLHRATSTVAGTVDHTTGAVAGPVGQVPGGDGPADLLHHATNAVPGIVDQATGGQVPGVGNAADLLHNTTGTVADTADHLPGVVNHATDTVGSLPSDHGPANLPGAGPDSHSGPNPALPPADPEITGPVPAHDFPGHDAPTPPTGQTVQAGFAGTPAAASVAPVNLPPAAPPPLNQPAPTFGGPPAPAGPPPFTATPAPASPPVIGTAPPRPTHFAPATQLPADRPQDPPPPRRQLAGPPGAPPPARGERNEVLAAFWIHMFPIGHLPVASYRPARQLPPPPEELDYAAGLRFEPADHPQFDLVDTAPRLAELKAGTTPVTPSVGLTADHPKVAALLETHDPLGNTNERDWDRRYLVRLGSVTAHGISPEGLEHNWPTSEQYPEGGSAEGEPEVLEPGTVIDRFGSPLGRVFAEDGTPFPQRSLPPAHKDTGYYRYRVTNPLPVWRAVSAAWFGQPGGGVRYRTTHSAAELVALGYLEEIA
ncbi:TNT domain-containing protein [Actinophytocola oryzae]|uniref:Uncharacterized protein DUF4237 n=1 Tax=Actinophytocola oryzae TaxID=502181 RepID=A0A4V3FQA5_9PSEU|nr:TNT domain-containing protein [Actinophytocola oryzae]TDV36861.1 uncharacterized protein DUF4237 [Actinophytocola oryzae]